MKKWFLILIFFTTNWAFAQISITNTSFSYSQDFNSLASTGTGLTWTDNSTIAGWYATENSYDADDGSLGVPHQNTLLSLGSSGSSDRALGPGVKRNGSPVSYGIIFVNNSGYTIIEIGINFYGEQWYVGGTDPNTLTFSYQINAIDITSGTWTPVSQLDFTSPNVSGSFTNVDGNNPSNRTYISYTLSVTLNQGDNLWLRWTDTDESGPDHTTSIDDFNFSVVSATPVELTMFSATSYDNIVNLKWETATEVNNYGFEIQRQSSQLNNRNSEWKKISFVKGYGNSNSQKYYSFTDKSIISAGEYYYRLKQIDNDGAFEYSDIVKVVLEAPEYFELAQNFPNPFNPSTTIRYQVTTLSFVTIQIYDILGNEITTLVNEQKPAGKYEIDFTAKAGYDSGVYIYKLTAGNFVEVKKMILLR